MVTFLYMVFSAGFKGSLLMFSLKFHDRLIGDVMTLFLQFLQKPDFPIVIYIMYTNNTISKNEMSHTASEWFSLSGSELASSSLSIIFHFVAGLFIYLAFPNEESFFFKMRHHIFVLQFKVVDHLITKPRCYFQVQKQIRLTKQEAKEDYHILYH